jgi:thymidylate synthase
MLIETKEKKMKEFPKHILNIIETVKETEKERKEIVKKFQPRAIKKDVEVPGLEWMSKIK